MPNSLSEIFGEGLPAEIREITDNLTKATAEAKKFTDTAKDVKLDPKSVTTFTELEDATKKATAAVKGLDEAGQSFVATGGKLKQITSENSTAIQVEVEKLVAAQLEVKRLDEQIRILNKDLQDGKGNYDTNIHNLNVYTQRLQENKLAVSNSTAELKKYFNQQNAVATSTDKFSFSIGRSTVNLGALATQIGRTIIRFTAAGIVIGLAVTAFEKLNTVILESIPGTEAYIQKHEKLIAATEALASALQNTGKAMEELQDLEQKLLDAELRRTKGIEITVAAYKQKENAIKAAGIVSGEVFKQEQSLFEQQQKTRILEIQDLEKKKKLYTDIGGIIGDMRKDAGQATGGLWTDIKNTFSATTDQKDRGIAVKDVIDNSLLTSDVKEKLKLAVDQAVQDKGDILKALELQLKEYAGKAVDYENQIDAKKKEIETAAVERQAKLNVIIYNKKIELIKATAATEEQYRQLKIKNDIETVDKIVADSRAKYAYMVKDIENSMIALAKNFGVVGNGSFAEQLHNARGILSETKDDKGVPLLKRYDKLLSVAKAASGQDQSNQIFELHRKQHFAQEQQTATEAQAAAGISAEQTNYGLPNYEKMVATLDKQTEAKKEHLRFEFQVLSEQYRQNGLSTENLEKQFNENLINEDNKAYTERLKLVDNYYNKLSEIINRETATQLNENQMHHLEQANKILRGGGSSATKDYQLFKEQQHAIIDEANINLNAVQKEIPLRKSEKDVAQQQYDNAKDPESKAHAKEVLDVANEKYSNLLSAEQQYINTSLNAKKALADEELRIAKEVGEKYIQTVQGVIDAVTQIQDNQFAKEMWQIQQKEKATQIQSHHEIAAIDATTGFAIQKSNEKARVEAQTADKEAELQQRANNLALKKAQADKQAAQMKIIVSTAAAVAKDLLQYPYPENLAIIAFDIALGAAQYAAASSAPLPQYFEGTDYHKGGAFVAGERNQQELVIPAGNKEPYLTGASPKGFVFSEAAGTKVIPLDKIGERTDLFTQYPDYAMLQGMYNNAVITDELKKMFGKLNATNEDGTGEIVNAIYRASPRIPDSGKSYERAVDKLYYLHFKP